MELSLYFVYNEEQVRAKHSYFHIVLPLSLSNIYPNIARW